MGLVFTTLPGSAAVLNNLDMAIRGEVFIVSWVSQGVPSRKNIQGQAFESAKAKEVMQMHTANLLETC